MVFALEQLAVPEMAANEAPPRTRRWRCPDERGQTELSAARARVVLYADVIDAATSGAAGLLERARARAIAAGFRVGRIEDRSWSAVIDAEGGVVAALVSALQVGAVIAEHGARIGVRMFVHVDRSTSSGPSPKIPAELDASIASQPEPGLWVGAAARRLAAQR